MPATAPYPTAPEPQSSLDLLEREITALGRGLAHRMARWLGLIAEFDRRDGARRAGFPGTSTWLAWACGISRRAAREHVRVARRLADLPEVRQAFGRGELSYAKVRAITRAEPNADEHALLRLAGANTADRLEQEIRALRTAPSADPETASEVHRRRRLDLWWDRVGALRVEGRLPPEDGAALVEAIETMAEALHRPPVKPVEPGEPGGTRPWRPPLPARRADALAELAHSGCPRTHVVLEVDPAALACTATETGDRQGERCSLRHGPAVPSETARRLACDAELTTSAAEPDRLHLGRTRRVVSPPLRASLERRDAGCRFPGCPRRHGLAAHHIQHWAHGGPTDPGNLVLLCRYHHRLVHEGGFRVERASGATAGAVRFRRPDGRPVELPAGGVP